MSMIVFFLIKLVVEFVVKNKLESDWNRDEFDKQSIVQCIVQCKKQHYFQIHFVKNVVFLKHNFVQTDQQ